MSRPAPIAPISASLHRLVSKGWVPVLLAGSVFTWTPCLAAPRWVVLPQVAPAALVSRPVTARIDVEQGRLTLISESEGKVALRRGVGRNASGDAQLEVTAGSQVRISLDGDMTLEVFGPTSLEWHRAEGGIALVFHQLGWADVDVRSGEHVMTLPAQWSARFGRSSFHLRSLAGGPTELRHHAGSVVSLDWRGDEMHIRPPVSVYPGSSVRLDRPRYDRIEGQAVGQELPGAWDLGAEAGWPWRARADSEAEVREREILRRETQEFDELPGAQDAEIGRLRVYQADGSSQVRPLRRWRDEGQTYAQVPVGPGGRPGEVPRVEIVTRPGRTDFARVDLPRRPESGPLARPSLGEALPLPPAGGQAVSTDASRRGVPGGPEAASNPAESVISPPEAAQPLPMAPLKKPFRSSEWRGLSLPSLNGVGEVAAERGSGVEVRVLGAGRIKVFVSASSPSPRWCFAPGVDYLLSPGAVVVFEKDGTVRMSFGEVEEKAPIVGRPSFSELER